MTQVRKAVIAVAGFGTRFLPLTKAVPKEMLPIQGRPIIHYIVEELTLAGVEEIIFVTNDYKQAIKDYFGPPPAPLVKQLEDQGKTSYLEEMKAIGDLAKYTFLPQVPGYGNALPALTAKNLVGNEPFIYVFADDLVKSDISYSTQLINTYMENGCSVIGVQELASSELHKYGVVKLAADGKTVESIVEKPAPGTAPSNMAAFGRYLFTPEIFIALEQLSAGKDGEYWIADAIEALVQSSRVIAKPVENGRWITTGDPATYLEAVLAYAKEDDNLKQVIINSLGETSK